jgi:hypothetical protein
MKLHHLKERLRKVESILRCEPNTLHDLVCALLWFSVAYYLGNPLKHEKPFAAYARALGYANESELDKALKANNRELLSRFAAAEKELYAKFGAKNFGAKNFGAKDDDWKTIQEALQRMLAGLPKSYKDQIKVIVQQSRISLKWMRNGSEDLAAYIRCFA